MYAGRIVETGAVARVFDRPATPTRAASSARCRAAGASAPPLSVDRGHAAGARPAAAGLRLRSALRLRDRRSAACSAAARTARPGAARPPASTTDEAARQGAAAMSATPSSSRSPTRRSASELGRSSAARRLRGLAERLPAVHALNGVSLEVAPRRDARHRRRIRLRQVHARPLPGAAARARRAARSSSTAATSARSRGAERRAFNRRVQMIFQDPYGSLNPRMTRAPDPRRGAHRPSHARRRGDPRAASPSCSTSCACPPTPPTAIRTNSPAASASASASRGRSPSSRRCIVADELVSALDVSVQAQVVNLLLDLQERLGLTVIFVAHDLRLVRHISHRVAVMYLGNIVETGPTRRSSQDRAIPIRGRCSPPPRIMPARRRRRPTRSRGELPSPLSPPTGCPFHPRCAYVQPVCRELEPMLEPRGGGWPSACHFADLLDQSTLHVQGAPAP